MNKVIGLDHVITDLAKAGATIAIRADRVVSKNADKVRDDAARFAPKGPTRDLEESMEATRTGQGQYEVGPTVREGPFMEFGTYKDAPQPYLWPASEKNTPDLIKGLEEAAGDV